MSSRATIYDVAKKAGVSPATVSRVFSQEDLVAEATRERVIEVARKLNFTTNRLAAGLRRGKTEAVSFVFPYNTPELMDVAQQKVNDHRYALMVQCTFRPDVEAELRALTLALEHRVAGLIWQPVGQPDDYRDILPMIRQSKTAVVMLERGDTIMPEADLVYHDTEKAAHVAVKHLREAGYRKLAYIYEDDNYVLRDHRVGQFRDAAGREALLVPCSPGDVERGVAPLLESMDEPIGFYADGDWTGLSLAESMQRRGLVPGRDAGLILLGDMLIGSRYRMAEMARPSISAMQRRQRQIVESCIDRLFRRIETPRQQQGAPERIAVPIDLVPRQSTQPNQHDTRTS